MGKRELRIKPQLAKNDVSKSAEGKHVETHLDIAVVEVKFSKGNCEEI